ncbi:CBS domain-containing protein [Methylomicrobium sp. Wu6]|uniref:CBS domain-containing protein n=1 Tax=Methylomicrobium sp. Wu6 TaxID=3107928 RepID=UPI002DD68075|nr:CBS domain-containing protein [Methylomicrobium sp. Wu6]MEC4749394.1 CBS domain-containing protein [Methylomicrobium sp. Wu6]
MLTKIAIADYMTKHLVKLTQDLSVIDAIKIMLEHKITSAPVVDDQGHLLGMFSEMDGMKVFLDSVYNQGMSGKVGDYMTKNPITVQANSSIVDLAEKFQNLPVRSFPVFEGHQMVGIISRVDLLRAFATA